MKEKQYRIIEPRNDYVIIYNETLNENYIYTEGGEPHGRSNVFPFKIGDIVTDSQLDEWEWQSQGFKSRYFTEEVKND